MGDNTKNESVIEQARKLYVELTCCDNFTDEGEYAGKFCPSELLDKFDLLFCEITKARADNE